MDVRIGVTQVARELVVEMPDGADTDQLRDDVARVLADGSGLLHLTDKKGRQVIVPTAKVAYVEIGSPDAERRIGFGG